MFIIHLCRCSLIEECKSSKSEALGTFNAISSLGFVVGPPLHGYLVEGFGIDNGIIISYVLCSFIFLINLAIVIHLRSRYVTAENNGVEKAISNIPVSNKTKESWMETLKSLSPYHRGVFMYRFLMALSVMMFRTSFVLWLKHYRTELTPLTIGYFLSYNGFLGLVCGFAVGKISSLRFYRGLEAKLNLHACFLVIFAFLIILVSKDVLAILIAMTILTTGTAALRVCGFILTAKHLEPNQVRHLVTIHMKTLINYLFFTYI